MPVFYLEAECDTINDTIKGAIRPMKIKNRFKKAVAVLMLVTMTAISVCACADKSGSDKAGEPGAVQGNYYLDADK